MDALRSDGETKGAQPIPGSLFIMMPAEVVVVVGGGG